MKWVVIWSISTWISTPCTDSGFDKFGRIKWFHCGVAHGYYEETEKSKIFSNEKEAKKFFDEAEKEGLKPKILAATER